MKFTFSNVLNGGFSNLGKGFVPLLLAVLALHIVPVLGLHAVLRFGLGVPLGTPQAFAGGTAWMAWAWMVVAYLFYAAQMSAIYEICVLTQANKPVKLGEVFGHAVANVLPIVAIYVLCTLGWMIGLALLIIPAFIFGVFYSVVVPVYVAEKPGIFGAFSRSQALTKGHRWAIFWMWVLFVIVLYVVEMLTQGPLIWPALMGSFQAASEHRQYVPQAPGFLTTVIVTVLGSVLWTVTMSLNASFYTCLRAEKDGLSSARVEKIFE
jgi:hypothetical protein